MASAESLRIVCGHCTATNRLPAARRQDRPKCGRCKQRLFAGVPVELSAEGFEATVRNSEIPVLVDFWAPWCGPCRMMAPTYARAANLLEPRIRVARLDTERAPELARRLQIRSVPTLALFVGGREIARSSGAVDLATLQRWVESQLARAA